MTPPISTASLSDLPNYVADAFLTVPATLFVPEDIVFGTYAFLPWVRTGIIAGVTAPPATGTRAQVPVALTVEGAAAPRPVAQTLLVRGPGDVVTVAGGQVIRRYPEPGSARNEDSFLAHIEFDRPDLPWIFTPQPPASGGTRLRPWLALVVLRAARAELTPAAGGLPARVRTAKSELQPLTDSWAWAHAQIIGPAADVPPPSVADRLTPAYGDANLSRLLCPRRLAPTESYLACLVPAFDAGRATGLGESAPGTLADAWTRAGDESDADEELVLPVYSSWTFSTGLTGDFRSLAEQLDPVPAPWPIGRRVLDVAAPAGGLPPLAAADPGRLQTVRGPLVSPSSPDPASADPVEQAAAAAEAATWPAPETEALRTVLDAPSALAGTAPTGGAAGSVGADDLPLIGPEIYARYQAAATRVDPGRDADWFGQLNLRPADRVVAGLGTRVVQRDQEQLMQAAWAQVGDVNAANAQLRRAQLARFGMGSVHARHLATLAAGPLLALARPVHGRLAGTAADVTVHGEIDASALAPAATTAAFRRVTRPRGPLLRYAAAAAPGVLDGLLVSDGVARDFQRPYADLDAVAGLSEAAARVIDPAVIANALGTDPTDTEGSVAALVAHGALLTGVPALPDVLTPDAVAKATPAPGFVLADAVSERLLWTVTGGVAAAQRKQPGALLGYAGVLAAVQAAGGPFAQKAASASENLRQQLLGLKQPVGDQQFAADPLLAQRLHVQQPAPAASAAALGAVVADLVSVDWPGTPVRPAYTGAGAPILAALDPRVTATSRILARLGTLPAWLPGDWFADGQLSPIMAAPVFTRPMYAALADYDREWLIPGLAQLPEPDLVTALLTNPEFIEAFLVGLSSEMGRELLWRGYPTDQRGTYFRRFFNAAADELTQDIHRFTATPLGQHLVTTLSGRVVLLVRGELIRRYPNALVLAMRSGPPDATGHPVFADGTADPTFVAPVLFTGRLAPDMVLAGFDLTAADVLGAPWWFLIAEHPTAPRFGLAESRAHDVPLTRDSVAWGDLPTVHGADTAHGFLTALTGVAVRDVQSAAGSSIWGSDAGTDAHLLLVDPVRAAFAGQPLLAPTGALG